MKEPILYTTARCVANSLFDECSSEGSVEAKELPDLFYKVALPQFKFNTVSGIDNPTDNWAIFVHEDVLKGTTLEQIHVRVSEAGQTLDVFKILPRAQRVPRHSRYRGSDVIRDENNNEFVVRMFLYGGCNTKYFCYDNEQTEVYQKEYRDNNGETGILFLFLPKGRVKLGENLKWVEKPKHEEWENMFRKR